MPFDDIVWHFWSASNYAPRGEGEFSNAIDVRFGQTADEDSHSAFSWPGNRRYCMAPFFAIALRLQHFPYSDAGWQTFVPNPALDSNAGGKSYPQTIAWFDGEFSKWKNSGADNIELTSDDEWHSDAWDTNYGWDLLLGRAHDHVFGWPDIPALANNYSARLYSTNTVDGMTTNDLTTAAGYSANQRRDLSSSDDHSTLGDHLFQAQNREGCHQLSTSANIINIDNPFIGIHKDFPLKITTTKNYNGFRLVLKRKRYLYNQKMMNLSSTNLPNATYKGNSNFPQSAALFYPIYAHWNSADVDQAVEWYKFPQNVTIDRVVGAMFSTVMAWPKNNNNTVTVANEVENAEAPAGSDGYHWTVQNPVYWSSNGWAPGNKGMIFNQEVTISEAVINRTIVPREQVQTGSVNIKNITIKENGTVLKAEDDVLGKWVEVPRSSISSLGKANTSGATLTFQTLFSLIRTDSDTSHDRYVAAGFQIKFAGDSTWYEITAANRNGATISPQPSANKSQVDFTLRIPRGSPDPNYTWGNYRITNFDGDNTSHSSCDNIRYEHDGSQLLKYARNETPLYYDLFISTGLNETNGNETLHGVTNLVYYNDNYPTASSGKAVRQPHFGNELGEQLSLKNDFSMVGFWERFRLGTPNSGLGHYSADIGGKSLSWSACNWVEYYEKERAVAGSGSSSNTKFTNMKQLTLDLADLGFVPTEREVFGSGSGDNQVWDIINLNVECFMFGGIDKVSGSIWPSYKINLAAFSPGFFAQNFSTAAEQWTNYFSAAKAFGSGANVAEHLDQAWYAFCAHEKDSALIPFYTDTSARLLNATIAPALTMQRMYSGTNRKEHTNARSTEILALEEEAKQVKTLLHPWVTASYGYDYDHLGWGGEMAGTLFHAFTIYDSDKKINEGTVFEVSLHQAGIPFCEETDTEDGGFFNLSPLLGLGTIMLPVDNYQLFIVAK